MEKQLVLLDTKKEYIEHLLDVFTILIAKRIYKIFNENEMNVKKFQEELVLIKIWNNNKVVDEYNEIIKKSKCNYLEKLLNKIVYLDIKIKLDFNVKLDNISIIKPCDFIHKCLINSAVFCWKNVYLFSSKNLKPSEKQYHLNIIEKNIRKNIKNTIRNIIPYETILNLYEEQKEKERLNAEKKLGGNKETDQEEETDEDEEETDESDEEETDESDETDEEIQTGIPINVEVNKNEVLYLQELIETKEAEANEVEAKEVETKEAEAIEVKAKEAEAKEVEAKEAEANEVEAKEVETEAKDDLESLLEDDNDFIDTSIFKKKKKEKSKKVVSSDEEDDEESDLDIEIENNEDIKKINISSINKKNRH